MRRSYIILRWIQLWCYSILIQFLLYFSVFSTLSSFSCTQPVCDFFEKIAKNCPSYEPPPHSTSTCTPTNAHPPLPPPPPPHVHSPWQQVPPAYPHIPHPTHNQPRHVPSPRLKLVQRKKYFFSWKLRLSEV